MIIGIETWRAIDSSRHEITKINTVNENTFVSGDESGEIRVSKKLINSCGTLGYLNQYRERKNQKIVYRI